MSKNLTPAQVADLTAQAQRHKARIDAYCDAQVREGRWDSDFGLAVAKQLAHISRQLVRQRFRDLRFRDHIPPVMDPPPVSAATYEWHFMEFTGEAEISASLTGSSKRVDLKVSGEPNVVKLYHLRASYQIADDELEEAEAAGVNVSAEKPMLARQAIERTRNRIAYLGDATFGLKGLLTETAVNEVDASKTMATMTADEMLEFLLTQTDQIWIDTAQIFKPDTVLLPPAQFKLAKNKRFTDGSGQHVLDVFLQRSMFIKTVDFAPECTASGSDGTDALIVYAKDPQVVGFVESLVYSESAPTRDGFTTKVEGRGKFGGVAWRIPACGRKVKKI